MTLNHCLHTLLIESPVQVPPRPSIEAFWLAVGIIINGGRTSESKRIGENTKKECHECY